MGEQNLSLRLPFLHSALFNDQLQNTLSQDYFNVWRNAKLNMLEKLFNNQQTLEKIIPKLGGIKTPWFHFFLNKAYSYCFIEMAL